MTVRNMSRLIRKLGALGGNVEQALITGIDKGAKRVQGTAKGLAPVNDGELRNKIFTDPAEKKSNGSIEARIFATAPHAPYAEFGTGPEGAASSKGGLPASIVSKLSYRNDGWWIHESQIDSDVAEKYHFRRIETDDGIFYFTNGQPAQPFLFPAAEQEGKKVLNGIAYQLQKDIKKLANGGK